MKNVILSDEAFARLEARKLQPDESPSDVILRLVTTPDAALGSSVPVESGSRDDAARPADFLGCARGMVVFRPGWDEPEPLESWHAYRDDLPL